ncbi:P-loop containing nucleoside triphosphate hydrolase protein [Lentinula edodes]|uniref:p-loop containing nucleoside triphosphate hydrolase protein n=1 Tax=Lentinula edodes TaxID=5353 RepID=A0A1Q3E5U0_LENED|nr:P-loop containing nucleoside triphosphate hydrolase protein [Lentinula edodes]
MDSTMGSQQMSFMYSQGESLRMVKEEVALSTFLIPTCVAIASAALMLLHISVSQTKRVLVPLCVPRKYVPVDPKHPKTPNPEQTCSILSRLTFAFMDSVILKAYYSPSLPYEDLPSLADYDHAEYLKKRSFRHLDPTIVTKRRNAFFSLVRVFTWEFSVLSVLVLLQSVLDFATPVGVKNLLGYIETNGVNAAFKPWVWIAWLFFGPLLQTMASESYLYITTRQVVHAEAILTEVILEHALRIRVKAETDDEDDQKASEAISSNYPSASASPSQSESDSSTPPDSGDEEDQRTLQSDTHSRAATNATEATDATDTTLRPGSSSSSKVIKSKEPSKVSALALTTDSSKNPKSQKIKSEKAKNILGKLSNLVTTDMQNITDGKEALRLIIQVPIQVALCVWFLERVLGWSAFVGLATIIILFPIPGYFTKLMQSRQKIKMRKTDARIGVVTETLSVLRMVKFFGWESLMGDRIKDAREEELVYVKKLRLLELASGLSNHVIPLIVMLVTYATYTVVMKQELSASKVFSSMVVFEKFSMLMWRVMHYVNQSVNAKVSLDRVTEFLYETELLDTFQTHPHTTGSAASDELGIPVTAPPPPFPTQEIGFRNVTFSWSNDYSGHSDEYQSGLSTPTSTRSEPFEPSISSSITPTSQSPRSIKRQFTLKIPDEVIFQRNTINLIVGSTGSGKTSMLMALLGEMHFIPHNSGLHQPWFNLPRGRGVAYAAQESWVQNATIKENIIFDSPFEATRYRQVLHQCALEKDLELFQAGDETEVGEKGLTLSGGQKARVTLARAIYSSAEVLLLDDVLAALDVHTSKWIVEKCFKGDLVKDRTILLVTHNTSLTHPIAGYVVSLKDGQVAKQGTVAEVLGVSEIEQVDGSSAENVENVETIETIEQIEDEIAGNHDGSGGSNGEGDGTKSKKSPPVEGQGKLIVAEEIQIGNVGWPAVRLLIQGLGGQHVILFVASVFASFLLSESAEIFQTWFLGIWASQYERKDPSEVDVVFYLVGYSLILLFVVVTFAVGFIIYLYGVLRASRSIHKQLMQSVLGSTLRWLDTTPTSRVITRATQDMRDVDGPLPNQISNLLRLTIMMIGQFCSVIYFSPAFLVPGILVSVAGALCGSIYIKAQLPIKRIQSNAKAPVLAHFGTVMAGLVSVRAYGVQERFIKESLTRINYYSRPSRVFWNLNRWIDVRLDLLGNVFSASLAAYLVYVSHGQAATIGFSLNMAVMFSSSILYYIRIMNMFQVRANSLERINAYIEIEQEPKPTKEGVPPAYWPSSGDLRVENLSARYSPDGPQVLQGINFHIKSGERIGVVGRTGSGKSSLMLSLLRCIYTDGEVYLDGLSTSTINLDDLRTKITIIPQMPELLSGTVRRNLDPFDQYDDAALYDALRSAGLYSIQSEDEDARVGLDTAVASGGGNLSVGQRQIIALARAMVRESKLLILDEATSAIDYKTDAVIQSSLRHELKGDVTLITVAHRLQTIMDADKIMVLDAGRIVEYDSPEELLKNESGHLRALVDESADKEHLYQMAGGVAT